MDYPLYLEQFSLFRTLIKLKKAKGEFAGTTLILVPNLFGTENLIINGKEYILLEKEDPIKVFNEVWHPLLDVLIEEEVMYLCKKTMQLEQIWNYSSFQGFLRTKEFCSEFSSDYCEIETLFYDTQYETSYYKTEELINFSGDEAFLRFLVDITLPSQEATIENWIDDKRRRLPVLLGNEYNPNDYIEEELIQVFSKEEAWEKAINHPLVSEHYSDFEDGKIAFNIKVHESFIHESLYELGFFTDEDEWNNRKDATDKLFQGILSIDQNNDISDSYETRGSSGGYLILSFYDITPSLFEEVVSILENNRNLYQEYQSLSYYYDYFQDILDEEEKLMENNPDNKEIIQEIMKEIHKLTIKNEAH